MDTQLFESEAKLDQVLVTPEVGAIQTVAAAAWIINRVRLH